MGFWELYARVYDALPRYFRPYQKLVADVVQAVENGSPQGRILDAGCGTGNYAIELAKRGFDVVGIDSSDAMLKRAEKKKCKEMLENIELSKCDIEEGLTSYPDNTFACVVSIHTLYILSKPETAMREYYRLLKPSGRFVLAEFQHPIRIIPVLKEANRDGGIIYMGKVFFSMFGIGVCNIFIGRRQTGGEYHYWNEEELRSKLENFGFRVDTIAPAYTNNWDLLVNAVKPKYDFKVKGYRFLRVETGEDLAKALRLRYSVYCERLGYRPANETRVETDVHDEYGTHFLALDRNNRAIGTIRFIPNSPTGFPMEPDFPLAKHMRASGISKGAEVSRFVILHEHSPEDRRVVPFGLFKCIFDHARETDTNDLFATSRPEDVDGYRSIGFDPIGEPFEYSKLGGLWVPIHLDIRKAYDSYLRGSGDYNMGGISFIVGDST